MNPEHIIVAFSFGKKGDGPSESSRAIARHIAFCMRQVGASSPVTIVLAQWEVGIALTELGIIPEVIFSPQHGRSLSIRDVAEHASHAIHHEGWNTHVIVAAHPKHVKRAVRCLGDHGLIHGGVMTDASIGYDSATNEFWMRGRLRFLLYEILAAPFYFWRGELC